MTGGAMMGGLAVVEMWLVASVLSGPRPIPVPETSTKNPVECQSYVDVLGAADYARELDRPEAWVMDNYRIELWSSLSLDRTKSGEMLPGERARVLAEDDDGYKVVTSRGAEGWVSKFHVGDTAREGVGTGDSCQ